MRLVICALSFAATLPAGVIQGVTLDWASGKPLSRTIVNLQPVPGSGTQNKPLQTRSGRSGQFQFGSIPDGLYLLETQREGFLSAANGQRRPDGHGTPILVNRDTALFTELRLHRMGAITGTVLDENGIGIPRVNVVAYRAQLPLRIAGRGISDDRGVYRIAGLSLGKHWVRTASHILDDGAGLLPVFGPEVREPRDAQIHEVRFDNDTTDANIRPEPGTLSTLSGLIACDHPVDAPVTLTLSSEFSQQSADGRCGGTYLFRALAPAAYELFAAYPKGDGSGFAERFIGQNTQMPIQVMSNSPVYVEIRHAATRAPLRIPLALSGRRDDLSGAAPARDIQLPFATLSAGYWEFAAAAGPSHYVASITSQSGDLRRSARANRPYDWFPALLEPGRAGDRIRIALSDRPAQLTGAVTREGKRVPAIPVFLWPVREETRRQLSGARQLLSDVDGKYSFTGLPPGDYRVLATMDAREITEALADEAKAPIITLTEAQSAALDLPLWIAP